jgi:hypothetical protein
MENGTTIPANQDFVNTTGLVITHKSGGLEKVRPTRYAWVCKQPTTTEDGPMISIPQNVHLDKLPGDELYDRLEHFLQPVLSQLPDKRLRDVAQMTVQGILAARSPVLTEAASKVSRTEETEWPTVKRIYRFVWNKRISHRTLLKGLYGIAQCRVAHYMPERLVVALDPVNFEKPYTRALEGVSTVQKSTPPGERGQKRLTSGYPAITATVVNLPEPVMTYANWFSYRTADFVSENRELYRAIRITRALFPSLPIRFVGDAGLDDQKLFSWVDRADAEFIFRSCHDRRVEVYNDRLDRWEEELLSDLVATVPLPLKREVQFTHARKVRTVHMALGWLQIRLLGTQQVLWALVAHEKDTDPKDDLVLITNVPIQTVRDAETVYIQWRHRPQIEHTYRFDQEDGLDVEDMRVRTMERMRRVFVLTLLAALFVYHIGAVWPYRAVLWLRRLGGELGLSADLDGPYVLLAGLSALLVTLATLSFAEHHPFPGLGDTCG